MSASAILQELNNFKQTGTVLYIAAHPDDEGTNLIAFLARGRGYRTGYMALTRGDGGQNLIGPELREALGVIRTQELLAARRIDGAEQFFSRAVDFGFSKSVDETLAIWNRDQVLGDVVRVVRKFKPDVIVTRFTPVPGGTHGHHTASAQLAIEAFKLAGDPNAYPEQLETLEPWQPKRVLWNSFYWGREPPAGAEIVKINAGGYNPLLGLSYGEITARSRSMHKSQGFGSVGSSGDSWQNLELLAGAPVQNDLMDGIDTSWNRVAGGDEIGDRIKKVISQFDPQNPAKSVPSLLDMRKALNALKGDGFLAYKREQLDRIIIACLGMRVESVIPDAEVVMGGTLNLTHRVTLLTQYPVMWAAVRYPNVGVTIPIDAELETNAQTTKESSYVLPPEIPLTQPYWLRKPGTLGMFEVEDPNLIGLPENPPAFPVDQVFVIGGQEIVVRNEPEQVLRDPVKGEVRRQMKIVPPVSLVFDESMELFPPKGSKSVVVEVTASEPKVNGTVRLDAPDGWEVAPASVDFEIAEKGGHDHATFVVTAPKTSGTGRIGVIAMVDGRECDTGRVDIEYDHIPPQLLQPKAILSAVCLQLETRGKTIGYLPGAGDLVPESLQRMGYTVTILEDVDLTVERLRAFDAVIFGVRVFNTRDDIGNYMPAVFAYAKSGGTVIVQYNTSRGLKSDELAPFPLSLSNDRVTDENAVVTILAPDHPALNTPNKIVPADFDGWVQERGLYFPSSWDEHFVPLIACNDPGEPSTSGSLLVAKYGEGYFVYTGISWFRELPAGVPGAYRLFANLVSLGK